MISQILQLCGTDEGKVGRIEKEDGPVAQQVIFGVNAIVSPAEAVDGKGLQSLADQMAHGSAPFIYICYCYCITSERKLQVKSK
jgi:hypothetical protein